MLTKFDFDDVLIQPAIISDIITRSSVNPFQNDGFLPLITAPMDTVINTKNQSLFVSNKIIPCQPRGIDSGPDGFTAYSLQQFNDKFINNGKIATTSKILIDMANGHMSDLIKAVKTAKDIYGGEMVLMAGNVAHPETYKLLSEAGADYIRVGIGNGGGCLTTQQLGIGYPMGSLIQECYTISCTLKNPAKIVADGGMKKYSDIIKALALGADYVMVGSIFNKALESAGDCYAKTGMTRPEKISLEKATSLYNSGAHILKMFRGMSTKEVQKDWGADKLKTSEGIVKFQEVEYTISGWVENFDSYLRSAMSYTNTTTLNEFIGKVVVNRISENAFNRFNK